jgi:hypothetical protein
MAIDSNKMKQKLSALQGNGNGNSTQNAFWKPQDGDQTIRIVCPEDGDPFKQFYFHYNVGKNPGFLCPRRCMVKIAPFATLLGAPIMTQRRQVILKLSSSVKPCLQRNAFSHR